MTRQWFSVPLSAETWTEELPDSIELLEQTRNQRKLKRGALSGNQFRIRVRDLAGDTSRLEENLRCLQDLEENLRDQDIFLEEIPFVFQYNKQDLAEEGFGTEIDEWPEY